MQCIRCANEIITNVVQSNAERYVTTLTGVLYRDVLRFVFCQRAQPFRICGEISQQYTAESYYESYVISCVFLFLF